MNGDRSQSKTLEGGLAGLSLIAEPDESLAKRSFTAGEVDVVGAGNDEQLAMLEAVEQLEPLRRSSAARIHDADHHELKSPRSGNPWESHDARFESVALNLLHS